MWSQNMWANVFGGIVILYVITMVGVAMPAMILSIKEGLRGKPFRTLRDVLAEEEESEYLRIVSQEGLETPEIPTLEVDPELSRCSQCGQFISSEYIESQRIWNGRFVHFAR